jgi:dipeptidyl aminopeptidase/acylaminoacyl peptidase
MPEENPPEPVTTEKPAQPQQTPPESTKKSQKKLLWILVGFVVLILVGVGVWYLLRNQTETPFKTPQKKTTSAATPEVKKERTKVAYTDGGDIWVLDVETKQKMQITSDGEEHNYNSDPVFVDEDSFTHLKCTSSKCELWQVDMTGNKFTTKQLKKLGSNTIRSYDISGDLKQLAYLEGQGGEVNKLHLFSFQSKKDEVIHETSTAARGISSDDSAYVQFSPDGSKVLSVNTFLMSTGEENNAKIVIFNINGSKLASLSGSITEPVWGQISKSIIYRDVSEGIFSYDITTKKKEKLSSETDWSGLSISEDGKKLAFNKGFSHNETANSGSEVRVYNLDTEKQTLIADSLVYPQWVNDNYIVSQKLRKCKPTDENTGCLFSLDNYLFTDILVVVNVDSGESYEVKIKDPPLEITRR